MNKALARLEVSPARRIFGVGILFGLSGLLIYIGLFFPSENVMGTAVLLGVAGIIIWQGTKLYRATGQGLILTPEGLFETSGTPVCALDQIISVDRGFFAFKPSNGFLIRLKDPLPRAWAPGLWWRFGRRIGIGGATSARQGRDMADMIATLLTDRGKEILAQQISGDNDDT